MFRAPLCPSSGAHDDSVGYHIGRPVLELLLDGSLSAGRMDEFPDRRLLQPSVRKLIHPVLRDKINILNEKQLLSVMLNIF